MKIALVSFYSGSVNRGVEAVVHEIATRLSNKKVVHVFQEGKPNKRTNYTIISIPMGVNWNKKVMTGTFLRRIFVDYWSLKIGLHTLKILARVWKEKYDIVFPFNGGWQSAFLRLITWLYGGKMIIAGQSGMGWDDRNNLWSFPDAFVGLTSKAKRWAKMANPFLKNIVNIPNGVDLSRFKPQGSKFKTSLKKPIILSVGALTPQKRIDLVIKAVSKLRDVSLLIAGSGDKNDPIIELGKKLLRGRFEHIIVSFSKMPEVYRAVDLFTLVSESSEAFGNVFVEAMASGLAVVATDDEQRREIIGEAGIFVDPTDIDSYASALKKALSMDWGNKPRIQAGKFDWDKIVKKYEELFNEVLK